MSGRNWLNDWDNKKVDYTFEKESKLKEESSVDVKECFSTDISDSQKEKASLCFSSKKASGRQMTFDHLLKNTRTLLHD